MLWIAFAALAAFFASLSDVFSKYSLKKTDEFLVGWAIRVFALPVLFLLIPFVNWHWPSNLFWIALFSSGLINGITTILYMKAIKASDLSITIPIIAFTPLFMLITSPVILDEFPPLPGLAGIVLIVTGAYVLNIQKHSTALFAPFKALFSEAGPRFMLGVALLWSISANIDKVGVQETSPFFWVITVNTLVAVILSVLMLLRKHFSLWHYNKLANKGGAKAAIKVNFIHFMAIGLFSALLLVSQMSAIALTYAAYVIAIKRTSLLGGVIFGHVLFKEADFRKRFTAAAIMLAGVALMALS